MISTIEKIDPTGRKLNSLQQFETTNLFTNFYITLFNVVTVNKMHIKICGNCERYFITHKETVTYCDRITKNNLTCKDIGNKEYQKRKKKMIQHMINIEKLEVESNLELNEILK